jgi:hypothetical protein
MRHKIVTNLAVVEIDLVQATGRTVGAKDILLAAGVGFWDAQTPRVRPCR